MKIAKPGSGERPLGIPAIRDRVAETSTVLFLEPDLETDFVGRAYAIDPDTVQMIHSLLSGTIVVRAGAGGRYGHLPVLRKDSHRDLLESAVRQIADGKVLRLIKPWLKSPGAEQDGSGRWRPIGGKKSKPGTHKEKWFLRRSSPHPVLTGAIGRGL